MIRFLKNVRLIEKGIIEKAFRFFNASGIFKVLCPFFYYIFNKKRHIKVVALDKDILGAIIGDTDNKRENNAD